MKYILSLVLLLFVTSVRADVVVVAHPSNANQLTKDDVERIFLGKKNSFPDGSKVTPFYLASGNSTRDTFDSAVLGKSSAQLKSYWSKLVFTGKGTPPEELSSPADVKAKVASDSSALGYIDSADVDASVKVIFSP